VVSTPDAEDAFVSSAELPLVRPNGSVRAEFVDFPQYHVDHHLRLVDVVTGFVPLVCCPVRLTVRVFGEIVVDLNGG